MARLRRVALACGMLAAAVWPGALAAGPIEDALSLVAQGRHAEARALLEPLLEREPDAPDVRLLLGVLHAREGNYAEAITVFERLRDDQPAMFEAHNNLAVLYAKLDQLDDAREALVAALKLKPDAVVYANLGDVYMKLAERAYERAQSLQVAQDAATEASGQAVARSEPEETPVGTCRNRGGDRGGRADPTYARAATREGGGARGAARTGGSRVLHSRGLVQGDRSRLRGGSVDARAGGSGNSCA